MTDIFTTTIQYLDSIGFFKFVVPYILTTAIFYGLLRRSKIFGEKQESVAINATIALSAALLVTAAPILVGIDIHTALSHFLAYFLVVLVIVLVIVFVPIVVYGREISSFQLKGWQAALVIILIILISVLIASFLIAKPIISFTTDENIYSVITLVAFLGILIAIALFPTKKS